MCSHWIWMEWESAQRLAGELFGNVFCSLWRQITESKCQVMKSLEETESRRTFWMKSIVICQVRKGVYHRLLADVVRANWKYTMGQWTRRVTMITTTLLLSGRILTRESPTDRIIIMHWQNTWNEPTAFVSKSCRLNYCTWFTSVKREDKMRERGTIKWIYECWGWRQW